MPTATGMRANDTDPSVKQKCQLLSDGGNPHHKAKFLTSAEQANFGDVRASVHPRPIKGPLVKGLLHVTLTHGVLVRVQ